MCNCHDEIEKKVNEQFAVQNPDVSNPKTSLGGYALLFTEKDSFRPSLPLTTEGTVKYKNGNSKVKKFKQSMIATYCPFCGVKFGAAQ